jgi:hypothetical protein
LQVFVDLEAVVARIGYGNISFTGHCQSLGSIQGLRGSVYERQEGTTTVEYL